MSECFFFFHSADKPSVSSATHSSLYRERGVETEFWQSRFVYGHRLFLAATTCVGGFANGLLQHVSQRLNRCLITVGVCLHCIFIYWSIYLRAAEESIAPFGLLYCRCCIISGVVWLVRFWWLDAALSHLITSLNLSPNAPFLPTQPDASRPQKRV